MPFVYRYGTAERSLSRATCPGCPSAPDPGAKAASGPTSRCGYVRSTRSSSPSAAAIERGAVEFTLVRDRHDEHRRHPDAAAGGTALADVSLRVCIGEHAVPIRQRTASAVDRSHHHDLDLPFRP